MLRRVLVLAPLAVLAVALGACGGGGGGASGPAKQFTSLGCASCHTLKAAGASGHVGPNLDTLKPDAATVARQMTTGGGGMPSFKNALKPAELKSLAAWVAKAAAGD